MFSDRSKYFYFKTLKKKKKVEAVLHRAIFFFNFHLHLSQRTCKYFGNKTVDQLVGLATRAV